MWQFIGFNHFNLTQVQTEVVGEPNGFLRTGIDRTDACQLHRLGLLSLIAGVDGRHRWRRWNRRFLTRRYGSVLISKIFSRCGRFAALFGRRGFIGIIRERG